MTTVSKKRLTIDLSSDEHRALKLLASFEGVSMKNYMLSRTLPHGQPIKEDGTSYLLGKRKNKERLMKALSSKKPEKSFSSIKELKHAFGV